MRPLVTWALLFLWEWSLEVLAELDENQISGEPGSLL